jgi:hypothetical protein
VFENVGDFYYLWPTVDECRTRFFLVPVLLLNKDVTFVFVGLCVVSVENSVEIFFLIISSIPIF